MTGATTVPMPVPIVSILFQDRGSHAQTALTIESLREIDPNFRVFGRSTDRDIRVRRSLQTSQAVTNDEDSRAETSERSVQDARPCYQRSDSVEAEAPDESGFVAIVAEDPVRMAKGGERVGAEVGGLQTRGAGAGDVQDVLEVFV